MTWERGLTTVTRERDIDVIPRPPGRVTRTQRGLHVAWRRGAWRVPWRLNQVLLLHVRRGACRDA